MTQIILLGLMGLSIIHSADECMKPMSVVSLENERIIPLIQFIGEIRAIKEKSNQTANERFLAKQLKLYRINNDSSEKKACEKFDVRDIAVKEVSALSNGFFYQFDTPLKHYIFFGSESKIELMKTAVYHFCNNLHKKNLCAISKLPLEINPLWYDLIPNLDNNMPMFFHLYQFLKKKTYQYPVDINSQVVIRFNFYEEAPPSNDNVFQTIEKIDIEKLIKDPFSLVSNYTNSGSNRRIDLHLFYSPTSTSLVPLYFAKKILPSLT